MASESAYILRGEAIDGLDAIEKARALCPDVLVMYISMPNKNGLDATREIKRILPESEIIIVSQRSPTAKCNEVVLYSPCAF